VRKNYALEVREHRNRVKKMKTGLVVAIDADNRTVDQRNKELASELKSNGDTQRNPGEAIVHVIPKRNVETWIRCLTGEEVNEVDDYKGDRGLDGRIKPAAEALYDWSRPNYALPASCPDSLRRVVPELARIKD
jgi:hypothetical protein